MGTTIYLWPENYDGHVALLSGFGVFSSTKSMSTANVELDLLLSVKSGMAMARTKVG